MQKMINHFITITRHKYFVFIECWKRGLYWQGLVHDLSKYSISEFFRSAKYFQGDKTPVGIEKAENGYSKAWLHHKGHNKHHWEYWVDFTNGKVLLCPIPYNYILEMCCDMIGASKAYNKGEYNCKEPLAYFEQHKHRMLMSSKNKEQLERLLRVEAAKS